MSDNMVNRSETGQESLFDDKSDENIGLFYLNSKSTRMIPLFVRLFAFCVQFTHRYY